MIGRTDRRLLGRMTRWKEPAGRLETRHPKSGNLVRAVEGRSAERAVLRGAVNELAVDIGLERACAVLRVNRSGVYRDDACRRHLVRPVSMSALRPPSITAARMPFTANVPATLETAFAAHPKRFKGIRPQPPRLPVAAWINPPKKDFTPSKTPRLRY